MQLATCVVFCVLLRASVSCWKYSVVSHLLQESTKQWFLCARKACKFRQLGSQLLRSGCSGGGSGGLAGGSIHRSADLSGATSAATQSNDGGKFPTVNRLRGGAGSGDDVSVQTSSPDPSTSDLTLSGIDKAAASAAADLATGSRQRAQALGEFNSGGAGHSPQPLPAAPVLGTSRAPEALQGGLNAADVERTSFGASAGGLGARRGNKERKVGFLQQLSPLRLMGLNPTRSGLAPEGDSVSGSSAAGTTATGRSEGEVRHEQVCAPQVMMQAKSSAPNPLSGCQLLL